MEGVVDSPGDFRSTSDPRLFFVSRANTQSADEAEIATEPVPGD